MKSLHCQYVAHVRSVDEAIQPLANHLLETAGFSERFASAIGLPTAGRLLGILHDIGKYSSAFQGYIYRVTGLLGEEEKKNAKTQPKIDHSTAAAQLVWDYHKEGMIPSYLAQILAVTLMSHHTRKGMTDFVDSRGRLRFEERLKKSLSKTHKDEVMEKMEPAIRKEIELLITSSELKSEFVEVIERIKNQFNEHTPRYHAFSHLTRFLFSCLLDADRLSTADFENPKTAPFRTTHHIPNWQNLSAKLEQELASFSNDTSLNRLRAKISEHCRDAASRTGNIFTLEVPTGSGKTLASLRFALERACHAKECPIRRIIYVLPYTSIIDQNAADTAKILGTDQVLEHHSNLAPEKDTWRNRVLSENWNAPVVYTTSVQFLDALFASGTNAARRMHQLADSIVICDEIQSLPIKTIHLFNNAINFLTGITNTTVLLCTATMPLLNKVNSSLGAIHLNEKSQIFPEREKIAAQFERVKIINKLKQPAWQLDNFADFVAEKQNEHETLLIICNTKRSATELYKKLTQNSQAEVFYLSTDLCPAHRKSIIKDIRQRLSPPSVKPIICISTQLIEAGVDLDFKAVIRVLAGLNSIIQAAGRCNRNNHYDIGYVYLMNLSNENLPSSLEEIRFGQEVTQRLIPEFLSPADPEQLKLLTPEAMDQFYRYFYNDPKRTALMRYPTKIKEEEQSCELVDLLGINQLGTQEYQRINKHKPPYSLHQAFSSAAEAFKVIDSPTRSVVVPHGDAGEECVGKLAASFTNEKISLADQIRSHREAQQYMVNMYENMFNELQRNNAVYEIQSGEGIFALREPFYDTNLGVTTEPTSVGSFYGV